MPWGKLTAHMHQLPRFPFRAAAFLLLSVVLCGCAGAPPKPRSTLQGDNTQAVDFSGSWEMDYSQSDNAQQKLDSMVRELNREAERRARGLQQGPVGSGMYMGNMGPNSGESILGLVRLADLITQSPLLEIKQDPHKIQVEREEDFALTCEFYAGKLRTAETPFGTEICGWNGHQLVFKLLLPDGLRIQHVMTMGAAGQKLNIATTVATDQVSFPFTLNRVYNRFEPGESGFKCEVTVTRGRVCTTESR
jgi:hypothetical protein